MKFLLHLPTSQKTKGETLWCTGNVLGEGGANPLRRSGSWGWDRTKAHTGAAVFSAHECPIPEQNRGESPLGAQAITGSSQGLTMTFCLRALLGPDCHYCWCQPPGTWPPWSPHTPSPQNSTSPAVAGRIVGGCTSPGFLASSSALHLVHLPHCPGGAACLCSAGAFVGRHL